MEILEAYDLTGSYRAAAELAGCDHHTVARYVALREAGQPPVAREHRARPIDDVPGQDRGAGGPLQRAGPCGCGARADRGDGLHRRGAHHPPRGGGGQGPVAGRAAPGVPALDGRAGAVAAVGLGRGAAGRRAAARTLWCAWLAWSRFRVVIPVWDKTLPTIVACLDATLRRLGGVPTYALTDNEKTVTGRPRRRDRGAATRRSSRSAGTTA